MVAWATSKNVEPLLCVPIDYTAEEVTEFVEMDMTIKIRKAMPSDADIIAAFNTQMAAETENRTLPAGVIGPGVAHVLAHPENGFYLVAEKDSAVVGCLLITMEWSDWRNGMLWWIQSVYVSPAARRSGVYRRMYAFVKELAGQSGVCGLRLYVHHANERARRTYSDLGMQESPYVMYEEEFPAQPD